MTDGQMTIAVALYKMFVVHHLRKKTSIDRLERNMLAAFKDHPGNYPAKTLREFVRTVVRETQDEMRRKQLH